LLLGALQQQNTVKIQRFKFFCASGVYNAQFQDEVTIIVVSTGWLLADVLSPDTLHVTVSTRLHDDDSYSSMEYNITVRVSLVTT
jgi:hypothetical protein